MFFSLIKEINRYVKHLVLWKTDVLKTLVFSGRKFEDHALPLKSKKVQGIFGKTFILALSSSAVFIYKTVSQISLNLFWSGGKRFLSEFLRK